MSKYGLCLFLIHKSCLANQRRRLGSNISYCISFVTGTKGTLVSFQNGVLSPKIVNTILQISLVYFWPLVQDVLALHVHSKPMNDQRNYFHKVVNVGGMVAGSFSCWKMWTPYLITKENATVILLLRNCEHYIWSKSEYYTKLEQNWSKIGTEMLKLTDALYNRGTHSGGLHAVRIHTTGI